MMSPDPWHTDATAEQRKTSVQKEQGDGTEKTTLRPLHILVICKATF